jgi:adenosylcobinamide kinase/adenosylcobinamide-phosphate guanylyltransferase
MNQSVAAVADQVWMSVSGLPLRLKPERESP